jgi:hypothetical protein
MGGIELRDGTLIVDPAPDRLDGLAIGFSEILRRLDVEHVYVAGYVSILAGRARSTEAVDVLVERIDETTVEELAETLEDAAFGDRRCPSRRCRSCSTTATTCGSLRTTRSRHTSKSHSSVTSSTVAPSRTVSPRRSAARLSRSDPSGPLKLQIAYKLHLGAQKDVEDAVLLYTVRGHGQWRPSRSVSGETRRRGRVRTTRTRRRLDAVHDRMRVARRGEHPPGESVTSGSPEV